MEASVSFEWQPRREWERDPRLLLGGYHFSDGIYEQVILDMIYCFTTKSVPERTNGLQSSETSSMYLAHIATRQ